jgi:hypothetical protein
MLSSASRSAPRDASSHGPDTRPTRVVCKGCVYWRGTVVLKNREQAG